MCNTSATEREPRNECDLHMLWSCMPSRPSFEDHLHYSSKTETSKDTLLFVVRFLSTITINSFLVVFHLYVATG